MGKWNIFDNQASRCTPVFSSPHPLELMKTQEHTDCVVPHKYTNYVGNNTIVNMFTTVHKTKQLVIQIPKFHD